MHQHVKHWVVSPETTLRVVHLGPAARGSIIAQLFLSGAVGGAEAAGGRQGEVDRTSPADLWVCERGEVAR